MIKLESNKIDQMHIYSVTIRTGPAGEYSVEAEIGLSVNGKPAAYTTARSFETAGAEVKALMEKLEEEAAAIFGGVKTTPTAAVDKELIGLGRI